MKPGPLASIVALILPFAGAAIGYRAFTSAHPDTIGGGIGAGIAAYLMMAIACIAGLAAAAISFFRGERMPGLAILAVVLNLGAIIGPLIWVFSAKK